MARPIWKGYITFGLVNVPITLYTAESRQELSFHLLDQRNKARIRYQTVNEVTGEEVPRDNIVKAYEYEDGQYVILTDEDFQKALVEATQKIELEDFVDEDAIDYVYFDKPYYLVPGKRGEKAYVLMREALRRTHKIGIAKVVIHTRQHLAALLPMGNALVLNLLRFHHELRDVSGLELPAEADEQKVTGKEFDMAKQLVDAMTTEWQPEKYRDEYRDALVQWIEKKAKEGEMAMPPEETAPVEMRERGEIVDIMDLLKKSVQKTSKERTGRTVITKRRREAPVRRKTTAVRKRASAK